MFMVFGVYIEGSDIVDGTTFSLPNGLTHSAMGEDFMKAYGEPDYKHDDFRSIRFISGIITVICIMIQMTILLR